VYCFLNQFDTAITNRVDKFANARNSSYDVFLERGQDGACGGQDGACGGSDGFFGYKGWSATGGNVQIKTIYKVTALISSCDVFQALLIWPYPLAFHLRQGCTICVLFGKLAFFVGIVMSLNEMP
jgi:hypothetical protein